MWHNHGERVAGGKPWELTIRTGDVWAGGELIRMSRSRARAIRRARQAGAQLDGNLLVWNGEPKRKRRKRRGGKAEVPYYMKRGGQKMHQF